MQRHDADARNVPAVFVFRACPGAERRVRLCGGSVRSSTSRVLPDRPEGAPPIRHAGSILPETTPVLLGK